MAEEYTYEYLDRRGITKKTHEFFGVKTQIGSDGEPRSVAYTHPNGAAQIRYLKEKSFSTVGDIKDVGGWGPQFFPAGSAKAITIFEGKDDAMSAWQMLGGYPVYSVKSAGSALSDVRRDYDYLNSFDKIYLCLDDDEPGRKATTSVAAVFGFGKIYHVRLAPYKDAHDFLEAGKVKEFKNVWWGASRYMPETVVSSFADLKASLAASKALVSVPWPFPSLEAKLRGIRLHKLYLLSGLEGIGKTEFHHELIKYLAAVEPEANIGIIHLEETHPDTMKIQAAKRREDSSLLEESADNDKVLEAYVEFAQRDDRIHLYRHASSDDPDSLCATIRFLVVACGCKYVFFDNYQKASQLMTSDRSTEVLDYLSSQLESLVKELPFSLFCISHENDNELTRGSRNVSKTCDVWLNMKRDIKGESNVQYITIFKNRPASRSGPAGRLSYDQATATLSEITGELPT